GFSRTTFGYLGNDDTLCALRQLKGSRLCGIQALYRHSEPPTLDLAVGDEGPGDVDRDVARHGEPYPLGASRFGRNGRIYADDLAPQIQQRASAVPRIDGG